MLYRSICEFYAIYLKFQYFTHIVRTTIPLLRYKYFKNVVKLYILFLKHTKEYSSFFFLTFVLHKVSGIRSILVGKIRLRIQISKNPFYLRFVGQTYEGFHILLQRSDQ